MDNFRTSGLTDDPLPAQTYGGFAIQRPATPGSADSLRLTARTFMGSQMRPGASRWSLSPTRLGGAFAVVIVLAALVGVGVTQSRWSAPSTSAPARTSEAVTPNLAATSADPVLPAPLQVASPQVAQVQVASAQVASAQVARLDTARLAAAPPAAEAAPPIASRRPAQAEAQIKTPTKAQSGCGSATAGGRSACPDAAFAALDKQLNAAFAAAMRSSGAPGPLGRDQQDWIIRIDGVRRTDPGAAEDLYRARIAELHALASRDAEQAQAPMPQNDPEGHP